MGLLDDLKKQAKEKEDKEKQLEAAKRAEAAYYETHLLGVMRQSHAYFLELVQQLKIVAPDVSPAFPLAPDDEPPITLQQQDYVFRSDNSEKPRSLLVSAECHLAEPCKYYVRGSGAVTRYAERLDSLAFPFYRQNEVDDRLEVTNATFVLEGPLRVQVRLTASPADKCVHIDLLNVDRQPQKRYRIPPERVNDDLLDRLARMLLREETTLVEVEVDDEVRSQLRRKLEEDNLRRRKEQAEAAAQLEAERIAEEEARVINRARRSVKDNLRKILARDSQG